MTTSPEDRTPVGRGRPHPGAVSRSSTVPWACGAAGAWSLGYGLLGLVWALGGPGFPFGGPTDDTLLAALPAGIAGPLIAATGLTGVVLSLIMIRSRGPGGVRPVMIIAGAALAITLAVVLPGHRPLMAVARTPLVLVGAPFGWPEQLSLGEFFASMYPWPVINELLLIFGGLLWGLATISLLRRIGVRCADCGRPAHRAAWTEPARARAWGGWAIGVAMIIPVLYALTRWAWVLRLPLGFSTEELRAEELESPGIWLVGAGLATLAVGGALLTLGLIQRWGEIYPRWIPFLAAKRVNPRTAIIPASIAAILVTSAGLAYLRRMLSGGASLDWGTGPSLLWPVWGIALAAATLAYHLRRRGTCDHPQPGLPG